MILVWKLYFYLSFSFIVLETENEAFYGSAQSEHKKD